MPSHVTLVARARVPRCAHCHDLVFARDAWRCARCSTLQHQACIREHGSCCVPTCGASAAGASGDADTWRVVREPVPFSWWILIEAPIVFALRTWNVRHTVEVQEVALFVMLAGCTFACLCVYGGLLGVFHMGE